MIKPTGLDYPIELVRYVLLGVAYQHPDPKDMDALYRALRMPSRLALPKETAKRQALIMAMAHADPSLLPPLYRVLRSGFKVALPKSQAQAMAMTLTLAGASAGALESTFMNNRALGRDKALPMAVRAAVEANLDGIDERYAPDGRPYTATQFADFFGDSWLAEWSNGPRQKRTAPDGIDYRASEFKAHFGDSWSGKWSAAPEANLSRIAPDGKIHTMAEFQTLYSNTWQNVWARSYEVLDLCAGLNPLICKNRTKCQWKLTLDWTTSCVPKPLQPLLESRSPSLFV